MNLTAKHKSLGADAKNWLNTHFAGSVKFDEPMSAHTSFKVGGPAEAYIEPKDKDDLVKLINWSRKTGHAYLIIGGGSNLLVKDGGLAGLVISLNRCLKLISVIERKASSALSSYAHVPVCRVGGFRPPWPPQIHHDDLGILDVFGVPQGMARYGKRRKEEKGEG